nr:SCO family protein [Pseudorhodobacter wandonensis]
MNAQTQEATFRPAFSLADSAGQLRTTDEFAGKFQLVFFGFTNCPDVCPTTLSEVAQVWMIWAMPQQRCNPSLFRSILSVTASWASTPSPRLFTPPFWG